ncbi:ATP-binding protein [Streptomyces sp. ID05-26A]|nr:ATP-binding protein [Streptomyces sp. ID05-26A]
MAIGDDPPDRTRVLGLDRDVADIAAVRHWARSALPGVDEDDLGDVLLVITELVSNVHDHAAFPAQVELRWSPRPRLVRIAVQDASPALPQLRRFSADAARGRGLMLVDQLSKRWGVTELVDGKTVWAVLHCTETP